MLYLLLFLTMSACAMDDTNININISGNGNSKISVQVTKEIYVSQTLENAVKKSECADVNKPLERSDFIAFLRKKNPDYFDEKLYTIKFRSTLRGSTFEVFPKEDK